MSFKVNRSDNRGDIAEEMELQRRVAQIAEEIELAKRDKPKLSEWECVIHIYDVDSDNRARIREDVTVRVITRALDPTPEARQKVATEHGIDYMRAIPGDLKFVRDIEEE